MDNKGFKQRAREHQIEYKEKNIEKEYNQYKTWLTETSSINGKIFYDGFNIFQFAKNRYPINSLDSDKKINIFADMLRSEHIPLNLFVPLKFDLKYCRSILNSLLDESIIKTIKDEALIDGKENIKIEYAPSPKENYLNDRTSFDTYIEYEHKDGNMGILCFEVKYTEKEYVLKKGSKEEKEVYDESSKYYEISNKSKIYKKYNGKEECYSCLSGTNILTEDIYRQIWRNQLLAESILLDKKSKFKYATSIIIYPQKNSHFSYVGEKYKNMLNNSKNKFILITYEQYILMCYKYCPNNDYKKWIDYLINRYII